MNDYWAAILFFLPAGIANMSPVFANHIPRFNRWKTPMDFGKTRKGRRLLGENKTWRGFTFGTLMGGLSAVIISILYSAFDKAPCCMDTSSGFSDFWYAFVFGCVLGFGALSGDAIKSFYKRLLGFKPGDSFFPLDQVDYILGGLIAVSLVYEPPELSVIGAIFLTYFGLHVIMNYLGFRLGIREKPI